MVIDAMIKEMFMGELYREGKCMWGTKSRLIWDGDICTHLGGMGPHNVTQQLVIILL